MKILLVGIGSIGQKEIKELYHSPLFEVVGAVDISSQSRQFASRYTDHVFGSLEDALEHTKPDLVRIATDPKSHFELAKLALEHNHDVYIEKIMTLSSKEAQALLLLAQKRGLKIYVRRNGMYTVAYQRAFLAAKKLGKVRHVHWIEPVQEYSEWSQSKAKWLKKLPGGIISEHLPHSLYTVRWFLGEEPDVVSVNFSKGQLQISFKTKDALANITYVNSSDTPSILHVVCSDGALTMNHSSYRIITYKGFEYAPSYELRTAWANFDDILNAFKNFLGLIGHYFVRELRLNQNSDFASSDNFRQYLDIRSGAPKKGNFSMDGEEGFKNVELFEKVWQKANQL